MIRKTVWLFWVVLNYLLLLLIFQDCMAGAVIEQVVKDREGVASKVMLYLSEHRCRTDHLEGGLATIIDFKNDKIILIDHRSKSYIETKLSQWEKEVSERFKKTIPDIKTMSRKIVVKRTGVTKTINGFLTEKIEILADGELIEENWVTRDLDMREIEKLMDRIAQGFSKEFRTEMKEGREIYEKMKAYGFPILVKDYSIAYGLGGIDVLEVKKIEKKELKNEIFTPPEDYRKIIPKSSK